VKNQRIPFDDKKVAEKYLQERFGKWKFLSLT
jgi:hypothetical protein